MQYWHQKRVWIVGASSGIGEGLVEVLALAKAKVVVSSRNSSALFSLAEKFPAAEISVITCDMEKHDQLAQVTEEAFQVFGGFDFVFLNAGMSVRDWASITRVEVEKKIMDINFWGPVLISKAILNYHPSSYPLHLVLTSSLSGKYGVPKLAAYAASKHAIHGYFDSLRAETSQTGLQIHIVIPGFIKTNITVSGLKGDGSPSGKMQNALANGMDPVTCARKILIGLERGKEEFAVGGAERLTVFLNRLSPRFTKWMIRSNPLQRLKKFKNRLGFR
jgi:dehydrogenase/reductase SDR family member 7B